MLQSPTIVHGKEIARLLLSKVDYSVVSCLVKFLRN